MLMSLSLVTLRLHDMPAAGSEGILLGFTMSPVTVSYANGDPYRWPSRLASFGIVLKTQSPDITISRPSSSVVMVKLSV
jgi:hypothetical protein